MEEENVSDFNFWPSFADLMLAIVLIMIATLFIFNVFLKSGQVDLKPIMEKQKKVIDSIAEVYDVGAASIKENTFGISTAKNDHYDIVIENEPTIQRITFSDQILFTTGDYKINASGEKALLNVGQAIKNQLPFIQEIQIQGHADIVKTKRYSSNLELASKRAIEVFEFLRLEVGIDPTSHLMSATSFGEYKPVNRSVNDMEYNEAKLEKDNETEELKAKNRRIELLLFYKN